GAQRRGCRHAYGNVLRTRPSALVAGQRRGTRRRDKLFERRFFSRHRDARRLARAAFECVSELLAGRLSGNVPRESSRAAGQRRSRSGAPQLREDDQFDARRADPRELYEKTGFFGGPKKKVRLSLICLCIAVALTFVSNR